MVPNNGSGNTYEVTIDSGLGDVVNLDISPTISSLVLGGATDTAGSTLQNVSGVSENLTVTGEVTVSGGGTLTLGSGSTTFGSLTVGNSNLSSLVQNASGTPATLTVTGATSIDINGALEFGSGSTLRFEGGLTVGGTRAPLGATFSLNDATATITGNPLFNPQSVVTMINGSTLTVNGNLTNNDGGFSTGLNPLTGGGGGGNTVTVNGNFTNTGSLTIYGGYYGGAGDTLNVTGTFTNGAGGTLDLVDHSNDVASLGMLSNSGTVDVGYGTTLNLTQQSNGITDVPLNSALMVNGTFTTATQSGLANGLAKLTSVEGALTLGNYQTTADMPNGGTLNVYQGASVALNNPGTTLAVTGALNDAGSINIANGAALSVSQNLTVSPHSPLALYGGSTLTVNGTLTNNSTSFSTGYNPSTGRGTGGDTLTVNGGLTNNGSLTMYGAYNAGAGDTLNVAGAFINGAAGMFTLVDESQDVANVATLSNSGSVYIGYGTTLHLTHQPSGITDVPLNSALTVNGTFTTATQSGLANGLAKLTSVEGALTLGNYQAIADTPVGMQDTLTVATGGSLDLGGLGTSLSVTGKLSDSGSITIANGAALSVSQGMNVSPSSPLGLLNGSTLTVGGTLTNNSTSFFTGYNPFTGGGHGGDTLTVHGAFMNSGSLTMYGAYNGGTGDTLNVAEAFTNGAGATLDLVGGSGDVANIHTLSNAGTVTIGSGTTLHLTDQPNGITDVPLSSVLTVNGTFTTESGNGLANLASVEGALTLGNSQTTTDTTTLTVAPTGSLALNYSGTNLSVTGALNDSGSTSISSGAALSVSQSMTLGTGSSLTLADGSALTVSGNLASSGSSLVSFGGSTLTVHGNLTNSSSNFVTGYNPLTGGGTGGNIVTVNGGFTNNGSLTMYGGYNAGAGDTLNVGGTLTNASGATLTLYDYSGDVANVHLLHNSGTVNIGAYSTLNLTASGTETNSGTINLGDANGPGTLKISAPAVTLSGSGNLIMSNLSGNLITAAASTDVFTNASTIKGSGNIGNGSMGFVNTGTVLANQSTPLLIDTSSSGFTNNGTLQVASGSLLHVLGGPFSNFSSNTLTGGTYNIGGKLEIAELGSSGGEITTNAATIILNGTASSFVDGGGRNALSNLSTNATGAGFTIEGGRNFTTVGNFTNSGMFNVGSSSTFTVGGTGTSFTQVSGTTTDDGTLAAGSLSFQTGSLFGTGTLRGPVSSSGTVTPGNSSTTTGILTDSGAYAQSSHGALDIGIAGTTVGSQYDRLQATGSAGTASLNGTLNISLLNFTPAVGNTFKIVTSTNGDSGQFSSVNGLAINSSEHFTITYQTDDVLLTVVSGPLPGGAKNGFSPLGSAKPASSGTLDGASGTVTSKPGLSPAQLALVNAGKAPSSSGSFQVAAASVMGSSNPTAKVLQTFSSTSSFAAVSSSNAGHAATSVLRFPTRLAPNSMHNNGAYSLRSRTVGGGFAVPLSHLSKPQWGVVVE